MLDHDTRHKEGYDPPTAQDFAPVPWKYDPDLGIIVDANGNDVVYVVGDLHAGYDTRNTTIATFIVNVVNIAAILGKANDGGE